MLFTDDLPLREAPDRRERTASYLGWGLLFAAVLGTIAFATSPAPYVVERPGPVFDTLGETQVGEGSVPLIEIPDETTYPTEGRLDLLTVYLDGSRENPLSWVDIAIAWFDPSRAVVPIDAVFPEGQTEQESDEQSAVAMETSQKDAIAAALEELGIEYSSLISVADVLEDGPSDGVLQAGDVVLAVNGIEVADVPSLREEIATVGVGAPLSLEIRRGVEELSVEVIPEASEEDGSPIIGILAGGEYEFPIDVRIQLENVGGPSAGMMFALGIYDKLTPGALTGGEHVAGTGTIAPDGEVGPIGGVVQKMYSADEAGADWFLAPEANCKEVVGHIPGDLEVFSVATIDDALEVLEGIRDDDLAGLPRCG